MEISGVSSTSKLFKEVSYYSNIFSTEKLVIVTPIDYASTSISLLSIVKSPLVNVWALTILLFTSLRKLLQKCTASIPRRFVDLLFETFGIVFGTASGSAIYNRPERVLVLFLLLAAWLAGIFCTGMLFEKLSIAQLTPRISNLSELVSNERFYIPESFREVAKDLFDVPDQRQNFETMTEPEIMYHIYNGNVSFSYILAEPKAKELMSNSDENNKANRFYIVPHTYLCKRI